MMLLSDLNNKNFITNPVCKYYPAVIQKEGFSLTEESLNDQLGKADFLSCGYKHSSQLRKPELKEIYSMILRFALDDKNLHTALTT